MSTKTSGYWFKKLQKVPLVGPLFLELALTTKRIVFPGSQAYWERRYAGQGNSGAGSYGKFAEFKADIINGLLEEFSIDSAIEFGCGDGNQLALINYPKYLGVDVSAAAIDRCLELYGGDQSKEFVLSQEYSGQEAELALSLDVLYHLTEEQVYKQYLESLFAAGQKYVVIYSSNTDRQKDFQVPHVRHRMFTYWVEENAPDWELVRHIPNRYPYSKDHSEGSFADFFVYAKA